MSFFSLSSPSGGVLLSGGALIDLDGTLVLELALFFVAFFALRALVFRPMLALIDAREAAIDGARREARELEAAADEKLRAFEAEMKKANVELAAERDAIRQDAMRLERELLAKARAEADATLTDANEAMQAEAAKIRRAMTTEIPELARRLADKLLGRKAA